MTSFRQNEDVYESEDPPIIPTNAYKPEELKNPEIELVHIDIDAAKKRFEERILNFRGVDFSDSIAKKRLAAYGSSAYVLEVVGKDYAEPETPEQKFNRLTCEINELVGEISNPDFKTTDPLLSVANVTQLLEEIRDAKANKPSGKKVAPSTTTVAPAKTSQNGTDSSLIPLEKRLRRLEALVGQHDGTKQPLTDVIEELKLRAESLNSVYIDVVESRLNQVLTKLDQEVEKKQKAGIPSEIEGEVNELVTLMKKWDASCSALPANLKKIQSLHCLHEQAQHFSERISVLAGIRDKVEKTVVDNREILRELQVRVKEDVDAMQNQMATLQKRLNDLGL